METNTQSENLDNMIVTESKKNSTKSIDSNNNSANFESKLNLDHIEEDAASKLLYEVFGIKFKTQIKWFNTIFISLFHIIGVIAFIDCIIRGKVLTILFGKLAILFLIVFESTLESRLNLNYVQIKLRTNHIFTRVKFSQ